MSKKITRTFETHTIYGAKVEVENGEVLTHDLEPIEIFNQGITQEKAIKLLQKNFGKKSQYVIREIQTKKTTYGIDFGTFMEFAEVIKTEKEIENEVINGILNNR